jgi:anti-anti-sigma factor
MNLSTKQEMCFFYHPSSGKDLFVSMGHTRLYKKSLNIEATTRFGTMEVVLAGQLGTSTIEKMDEFLLEYRYHFKNCMAISIDISKLDFINQFGVAALVDLVCLLKHEGLEVSICRSENKADQVLRKAGFYEWLQEN